MASTKHRKARRSSGSVVGKPPLDVEALWSIKRIGTPTLSPDGRQACSAVTSFDMETNESRTELWLFPTGLGGAGAAGARTRGSPRATRTAIPSGRRDGRFIAFTAKRKDDEEAQVYLIAPDGGEATRLTHVATGCLGAQMVSDGKRIAFVSWVWPDLATDALQAKRRKERKDSKVKAHVSERAEYRFWDHWLTDGREPHVFACDVASGRCRDLLAGTGLALPPWEPSAGDYDIAPDGREIAIHADLAPEPGMMNQRDIVTVDLATRSKRVLTAATDTDDASPVYSPDGRTLAFHSYDTNRSFNDQGRLTLLSRATGRMRALAPKLDRQTTHVAFTPDSRALLCTLESHGRVGIAKLVVDAGDAAMPVLVARRWRGRWIRAVERRQRDRVRPLDQPSSGGAVRLPCRRRRRASNRIDQSRAARATRVRRDARGDGEGLGRRAGADVRHLSAELRSEEEMAAAAFDPWRTARGAHGQLALPLEHAGVRRQGLRRRLRQLSRVVGLRPEVAGDDHPPLRRKGIRRRRGRH